MSQTCFSSDASRGFGSPAASDPADDGLCCSLLASWLLNEQSDVSLLHLALSRKVFPAYRLRRLRHQCLRLRTAPAHCHRCHHLHDDVRQSHLLDDVPALGASLRPLGATWRCSSPASFHAWTLGSRVAAYLPACFVAHLRWHQVSRDGQAEQACCPYQDHAERHEDAVLPRWALHRTRSPREAV